MKQLLTVIELLVLACVVGLFVRADSPLPDNCEVLDGTVFCRVGVLCLTDCIERPDYVPDHAEWDAWCEWATTEWECEIEFRWAISTDPFTSPFTSPLSVHQNKVYLPLVY